MKEIKNTTQKQRIQGWGTTLDDKRKVPTKYSGISFDQSWHDDMERWDKLPNQEKWEMAYWAEFQAGKRAGFIGLVSGLFVGAIAGLIVGLIL